MKIVEVREQKHLSLWDFSELLGKSDVNVNTEKILDILRSLEISHCLSHHIPRRDILNSESEQYETVGFEVEYYKFTFVGVIQLGEICFIVYPKYWEAIELQVNKEEKFGLILNVIEKYSKSKKSLLLSANSDFTESRFATQIAIIWDYIDHGIYLNEEVRVELDGDGDILWEKTINESVAYLNGGTPLYLEFYTKTNVVNEMDTISRIHRAIITEIFLEIGYLFRFIDIRGEFSLTTESLSDFGTPDYLIYLIEREQSRQFVTLKKNILELMAHYLKNEKTQSSDEVQLYGTTAFHAIWEDVCSTVYGNDLKNTMKSLGLSDVNMSSTVNEINKPIDYDSLATITPNKIDSFDAVVSQTWESTLLEDFVEYPVWSNGNYSGKASGTLILDVLKVDGNSERKTFRIFDAKYYLIDLDTISKEKIVPKNVPGVSDITKQYLYQLAYKELAFKNGYGFTNAFVVPKDDVSETELPYGLGRGVLLGKVEMGILKHLGLEDIYVIGRDCSTLYKGYLLA